jgi:hypothetical protein
LLGLKYFRHPADSVNKKQHAQDAVLEWAFIFLGINILKVFAYQMKTQSGCVCFIFSYVQKNDFSVLLNWPNIRFSFLLYLLKVSLSLLVFLIQIKINHILNEVFPGLILIYDLQQQLLQKKYCCFNILIFRCSKKSLSP